jgi:hypothetical protein
MHCAARHRRILAAWLAAALLLMQWVTAAYACPRLERPAGAVMPASEVMPDCSGDMPGAMDPDQPQLCQLHCSPAGQSPSPWSGWDHPPGAAVLPVLLWVIPVLPALPSVAAQAASPVDGPPRGAPPLYIALLTLRN